MPKPNDINFAVSERELKSTYWYLTHQHQLRRLAIISLVVLSVIFYGFALWRVVQLFYIEGPQYRALLQTIDQTQLDVSYFHDRNKPSQIELVGIDTLASTDSRFDVVAQLRNNNTEWMARPITLELVSGGKVVAEQTAFIYPQQNRYAGFFGVRDIDPLSTTIRIKNVAWKRVRDYERVKNEFMNFIVSDIKFTPANSAAAGGQLPSSSLHFTITNATAYSYWSVGAMMALLSSNEVGAASYFVIDQFKAGETRTIDVRWTQPVPPIFETQVQPEVDVYDPKSYMPPT